MKIFGRELNPGITLTAIGIGHLFYGISMPRISVPFIALFKLGFFGKAMPENDGGFWFQMAGMFIITTGEMMRYYLQDSKKNFPRVLGYALISLGVFGSLAVGVRVPHGFYLLIAQGIYMLNYKNPNNKE